MAPRCWYPFPRTAALPVSSKLWLRLGPRSAPPPSTEATRPAIGSRPTITSEFHVNRASPAACRRARYRDLCPGQKHRAGRRARVQAVVERNAAGTKPEGDRRLSGGGRSSAGLPERHGEAIA